MSRDGLIKGGLVAAAIAVFASQAMAQEAAPLTTPAATDGPGANLVLEVAGEGNGKIVIDLLPDVAQLDAAAHRASG